MGDKAGLRQEYVAAIDFASKNLGKAPSSLTRDDLVRAIRVADFEHQPDIMRSLRILIDFKGLRELYCRGPKPGRSTRRRRSTPGDRVV